MVAVSSSGYGGGRENALAMEKVREKVGDLSPRLTGVPCVSAPLFMEVASENYWGGVDYGHK